MTGGSRHLVGVLAFGLAFTAHAALPVVLEGSPLRGAHGLAFTADGTLLVASLAGQKVYAVTGTRPGEKPAVRTLVQPPRGASDDVAVGPPGTRAAGWIVWSNTLRGEVLARDGTGLRVLARGLPGVNSVAFGPDGRLLAATLGASSTLYEIDLDGTTAPRQILSDAGGLNGFVLPGDGALYGPQGRSARIVRVDLATSATQVLATGFGVPTAVKRDAAGRLLVVDLATGILSRVDTPSGHVQALATFEPGLDNLAVAPDGRVFVSSEAWGRVYTFDPATGRTGVAVDGTLVAPAGLATASVAGATRVLVADLFSVKSVDLVRRSVAIVVPDGDAWLYPTQISVDSIGWIVSSAISGLVVDVAPSTGRIVARYGRFRAPRGAVRLRDGSVLVATADGLRRAVHDRQEPEAVLPAIAQPAALIADADGSVLVGDAGTGRMLRWRPSQAAAEVFATSLGSVDAACRRGTNVYVLDLAARRVLRVGRGGRVTAVANDLEVNEARGPLNPLPGIACTPSGVVVSYEHDGSLRRIPGT